MTALGELLERLGATSAPILAGGTDFYPALGDRPPPADVIDVRSVPELGEIRTNRDGSVVIGAGASWMDLRMADLPPAFDGLKAAAKDVGSVQIQHRATLAGNLCTASPAADGVPPLLTLEAEVELANVAQVRRLPLEKFLTGARATARQSNELLTRIHIPANAATTVGAFYKLGSRRYLVISIAMIAITLEADDDARVKQARVAVGACSPVALRLPVLEQRLRGCRLDDAASLAAVVDRQSVNVLSPIADVRATAEYRYSAVVEAVRRLLTQTAPRALRAKESS